MNSLNAALLINLIGFTVGLALYGMIAAMVIRHRPGARLENVDRLLLTTAALGLLWNVGELYASIRQDFVPGGISPWIIALAFSALGFLPSVVVHSAQADENGTHWLTYGAYLLSIFAAVLHLYASATGGNVPSDLALQSQTVGAVALAVCLLLFNFRQTLEKKSIWTSALLVFAVSALHLSGEQREGRSWLIELVAHQASLPIALTILYQNYRFAFADVFLKRAISLILVALTAFGLYTFVAAPLLRYHEGHERDDPQAIGLVLGLWIGTALIYPLIYKLAVWIVDTALLRRSDYSALKLDLSREIEKIDSIDAVLDTVRERLAGVLTARTSMWSALEIKPDERDLVTVGFAPDDAHVLIPTAEAPFFEIILGDFYGGRRLLSDEIATLAAIALVAARRIDVLRVSLERYEQKFREQEFAKLATEAQLTALRSQINPHFLFNALTTLGYLIKSSPDKAYDTLLRLTQLLRGVLSSTGEFSTLGREIELVESYLDIERARFEERLTVAIDVPETLRDTRVPSLLLQPLVENAIKHGISENRNGGEIRISARVDGETDNSVLHLSVWDSGAGKNGKKSNGSGGIGMRNIRERLESYYGKEASLKLERANGSGTEALLALPMKQQIRKTFVPANNANLHE